MEYSSVCCWVEDEVIFNLIRTKFQVVEEIQLDYSSNEKLELLSKLYHPHRVHATDGRVVASSKITIFVIKLSNPAIEIVSRKEHKNKPMYVDLISFKEYARAQRTSGVREHVALHAPDWLNESNHFFEVFNLTKYINKTKYFKLNELYGVVWMELPFQGQTAKCLKKLEETPHYHYIKGDRTHYEKYSEYPDEKRSLEVFDKMIKSVPSDFKNIPPILIYEDVDNDRKIVLDGLHRSCILLSAGCEYIKANTRNTDVCKNFVTPNVYVHEHFYDFEQTMTELEKQRIRYVIIRGFKNLPQTPSSDIDLVCHPDDYDKLRAIFLKRLDVKSETKQIEIDGHPCKYIQYKTNRITRKDIANTYFHIDVYDNCFTFYIKKVLLNKAFLTILFQSRIKQDSYYIPHPEHEYFLLLMRMALECKQSKPKHLERLGELKQEIRKDKLLKLFDFIENKNIRDQFLASVLSKKLI